MASVVLLLSSLAGAAASLAAEAPNAVVAAAALDDECAADDSGACALNALQLRHGAKAAERVDIDVGKVAQSREGEEWFGWGEGETNPLQKFNEHLDSSVFQAGAGLYYEFATQGSQTVWTGAVEARSGNWADATTPFPLASASKLFTALAVMRTMELKPKDWYPERYINTFPGWEDFSNFEVELEVNRSNLTVHHLLTHTSGLPFAMRSSKEDISKVKLFYKPGTQYGYTLGHRVLGWAIRDYWVDTPEGKKAGLKTVHDTYKFLIFDKMGLSDATGFSDSMKVAFGFEGDAGDAAIDSCGADLIKLAVLALRRGRLPNGDVLISEKNWNAWAVPNLLPGGKLSKQLVNWEGADASWHNWNYGGLKEQIMQQSGDFGWNYFGATYYDSKEIGWCGFFSSCLRVTYQHDLAFVMMQRDVADLKKSKPYLVEHFSEMAAFLKCDGTPCAKPGHFSSSVFCQMKSEVVPWSPDCPRNATRGKGWGLGHEDYTVESEHHSCYVPTCA